MVGAVVSFFGNFVFIGLSIVVFSFPFVAVFFWRHRQQIRAVRPHFNQFMEKFFDSKPANWLIFSWAAAEALFWFVIPEFLLLLVIFMRVKRKRQMLLYDLGGTAVGTAIGLLIALPTAAILVMPYIYSGMIPAVQQWYESFGIWALIHQPFSGVPYKVFLSQFHYFDLSVGLFFVAAIVVRIGRYAIAFGLLNALRPILHKFVYKHYGILIALAIAVFTIMLMRVSQLYK